MFHWFLGALPLRAVGYAGRKVRTTFENHDHLSLSFEFPGGVHVNFEANQLSPNGFKRVGEVIQMIRKGQVRWFKPEMAPSRATEVDREGKDGGDGFNGGRWV